MNYNRRKREMRKNYLRIFFIIFLFAVIAAAGYYLMRDNLLRWVFGMKQEEETTQAETETEDPEIDRVAAVIEEAELIAKGYDYDKAIAFVKADPAYRQTLKLLEEEEKLKEDQKKMTAYPDVRTIPHIFVNPLIADEEAAFSDANYKEVFQRDYITTDEFEKMLEELYDNDYVLVSMSDIAYEQNVSKDESVKNIKMKTGKIMLPEGKKPIVLSQENMGYPSMLSKHGFASRLVIDGDTILCEKEDSDGNISAGAFDLIPILENFIKEHPDFSYCGARALLGISGYDNVFGYSLTGGSDEENVANTETAKKIASKLKDLGYEFACNGYHYTRMGYGSMGEEEFKQELQLWSQMIQPVVGNTDIIMFPEGDDVGDWHYYSGSRYEYCLEKGFRYFVNMNETSAAWIQILDASFRQGRRLISGQSLYQDVEGKGKLIDLFDAANIYDPSHKLGEEKKPDEGQQ